MTEKAIRSTAQLQEFAKVHHYVLIDFYANWCGPCKAIAPYVHQKTAEKGIALAKVDVDECPDISSRFNITAMPTFIAVDKDLNEIYRKSGGSPAIVDAAIQTILSRK